MIPAAFSANESPLDSVNACSASVYTGTSSTVALNSSSRSAVPANSCESVLFVLPSLTNIFTFCIGLSAVLPVAPRIDIGLLANLLPSGNVAPVAAKVNCPDPSEEIVAP